MLISLLFRAEITMNGVSIFDFFCFLFRNYII